VTYKLERDLGMVMTYRIPQGMGTLLCSAQLALNLKLTFQKDGKMNLISKLTLVQNAHELME
jgi:hypothetical protein